MTSPAVTLDGKLIVRTVLLALGFVAAPILGLVGLLIWIFITTVPGGADVVLGCAIMFALLVPVVLFTVLSSWPLASPAEMSRTRLRWLWAIGAVEAVSIVGMIVIGFTSSPPIWLPITLVTAAVVFTAIAVLLGRVLRSPRTAPLAGDLVLTPWEPLSPKRSWLFVWIVAGIFMVVAGLALLAFRPWAPPVHGRAGSDFALVGLLFVLGLGAFAASIACSIRYLPVALRMSSAVGRNYGLRRKLARTIRRARPVTLEPTELELARRLAAILAATLPWQMASFALLYAGIICDELTTTTFPSVFPIGLWAAIVIAVAAVVLVSMFGLQLSRARKFLSVHGQPTATSVPPAPLQASVA